MFKKIAILAILILSVTGCSRLGAGGAGVRLGTQANPTAISGQGQSPTIVPGVATQTSLAQTDISTFVDASAVKLFAEGDKKEAASAQFYALQFGRPGAPRRWQGSSGASGKVSVGPYVRVNNLDCREFSHEVEVAGKAYPKSGTACREGDGHWAVVES